MIDTGYFARISSYPETDILIVISRYYPRWLKQGLLFKPEFAPSKDLLEDWKEGGISWEEYETRYRVEMDDPLIQHRITQYAQRTRSGQVHRFLCYEKEEKHCHRRLLKEIIEEASR